MKHLSTTPSSTESKKVFSIAGKIYKPTRKEKCLAVSYFPIMVYKVDGRIIGFLIHF